MRLIDRFTRDRASKFVWGLLTLAAILTLAFAVLTADHATQDVEQASEERAVGYVDRVLDPRLNNSDLAVPLSGQTRDRVRSAVTRSILADERVHRVRIWSTGGALLFSTDRTDKIGSSAALNDDLLADAWRRAPVTASDVSDTGGAGDRERSLLRTYVALGSTSVAEIDQTDAGTVAPVRAEWFRFQLVALVAALVLLFMTALSIRESWARINVGIPFAQSSIPDGYSLIDDERLHAVKEVYRLAALRVEGLKAKLAESEEAKRRLEGDFQRLLSTGATATPPSFPRLVRAAPPPEEPTPPPAPIPIEREVVQVPESDVVDHPEDDWAAAASGPVLRVAPRGEKPVAAPRRSAPAHAERSRREQLRAERAEAARAKAAAKAVAQAEKAQAEKAQAAEAQAAKEQAAKAHAMRAKAAADAERAEAAKAQAERARASKARTASAAARAKAARTEEAPVPERAQPPSQPVVSVPDAAPNGTKGRRSPVVVDPDIDDARAHEAALETFIRLTESDRQPHDTSQVDQGEVRAALARTAARKKPGGERLRRHDGPPEERQGGPPPGRR
jgi:hypothetical protein